MAGGTLGGERRAQLGEEQCLAPELVEQRVDLLGGGTGRGLDEVGGKLGIQDRLSRSVHRSQDDARRADRHARRLSRFVIRDPFGEDEPAGAYERGRVRRYLEL